MGQPLPTGSVNVGRMLFLCRHGEAEEDGELTATGREQARLLGERLRELGVTAIEHSPRSRAQETAELASVALPGVPVRSSELLDDVVPPFGRAEELPAAYVRLLESASAAELDAGARTAPQALARYAVPSDERLALVTHGFVVGWFVRAALDAPHSRWLGLNFCNASVTAIRYLGDRPPMLVVLNDVSHLPPQLRWTGFSPDRRL